jgi:hypothetical protein
VHVPVARGVQRQAERGRPVPPGPARLLVVVLERAGELVVDHHAHVRAVDAHAEGVRGNHDRRGIGQKPVLHAVPLVGGRPAW